MTALRNLAAVANASSSDVIAPDCRGLNFWQIDRALRDLLTLHLDETALRHFTPHFEHLGELAGGRLDELALQADKHPPLLHHRDRFGYDADWVEYHPAYREMERIGFGEFGLYAMSRRAGVLGWPHAAPPLVKYAIQYLFAQAEFALLCPLSVSDTSIMLIQKYGDERVKQRYLPGMLSQNMDTLLKGAQFMTEKAGGSDLSGIALTANRVGDHWELWGDKWFCSCADHDIVLLLARCQGAPAGNAGLSLFVMPRRLEDGSRNRYRVVRLKDKLGSRAMASGETVMEGAVAYLLGEPGRGLKQMMDQVNLSRLSHGFRAAGMMRRCLNEALQVARHRRAFGRTLIDHPMARMRSYTPKWGRYSVNFALLNRGKRSITVDLKDARDRERLQPLIERADVIVEQFRPGIMARFGLDYESVMKINPKVIYCSITGYGQTGPKRDIAGHDLNYIGDAGLLALSMGDAARAVVPPALIADIAAGAYPAVMNILLALQERQRTGRGRRLDIAMTDNLFPFMYWALGNGLAAGHWPGNGSDLVTGGTPRYRLYRTRDGKVLAAAPIENKFWDVFCDVIGLDDDLRNDAKDPAATIARVAEIIAADDASVWAARFAGKDSCCSVVVTIRDALNDPHFRARGLFDHVLINEDGRTLPALPVPIDSAFRAPPETAIAALHSGLKTRISPGESRARVQGFECRRAAHGSIGRSVIALSVRAG